MILYSVIDKCKNGRNYPNKMILKYYGITGECFHGISNRIIHLDLYHLDCTAMWVYRLSKNNNRTWIWSKDIPLTDLIRCCHKSTLIIPSLLQRDLILCWFHCTFPIAIWIYIYYYTYFVYVSVSSAFITIWPHSMESITYTHFKCPAMGLCRQTSWVGEIIHVFNSIHWESLLGKTLKPPLQFPFDFNKWHCNKPKYHSICIQTSFVSKPATILLFDIYLPLQISSEMTKQGAVDPLNKLHGTNGRNE